MIEKNNMAVFSNNGFYLYRNFLYSFELDNGNDYLGRLLDIKPDSIFITNAFNESVLKNYNDKKYDTLKLSIDELKKIKLINDRTLGLFNNIDLSDYDLIFKLQNKHCGIIPERVKVYSNSDSTYEMYPYLTSQGINWLYEEDGNTYYFMGLTPKPQEKIIDTNFIWLPICIIPPFDIPVDQINGIAAGFFAHPSNVKDFLEINGICAEGMTLSIFAALFGGFLHSDSTLFSQKPDPIICKVNGIDISIGSMNFGGGLEINGFYVGGTYTNINVINGFSISGVNTIIYDFNGVCISILRNQAKRGRGVQIGLFNSCWDFKGIQIGLWNKNQNRSFPFINWNF